MKKLVIISMLMVCIQFISAQKNDTIYYDMNWKGVSTKALATYKRIVYKSNDSQNMNSVKDFYITGELQSEGLIPVNIDKTDDKKSKFKGHQVTYYKSGKKKFEQYSNDSCQIEGVATFYYENGNTKEVDVYQNGEGQEATGFNESGVKLNTLKGTFKDGKLDDGVQTEYYENGIKKFEGPIKNGQYEGECIRYSENGLRQVKGNNKNSKWDGTCYQFNADGSYYIVEYVDGKSKDNCILVGVNGKRTKMKLNTKQ